MSYHFFLSGISERSIPESYFSPTTGSMASAGADSHSSASTSATSTRTVRPLGGSISSWNNLEQRLPEITGSHMIRLCNQLCPPQPHQSANPLPIYQGLYGDHPEPRFRGDGELPWSGVLPTAHHRDYRSDLALMYLEEMGRFLSASPDLEDVQAVVNACWSETDGPMEILRPEETRLLEGRHLVAARDVLSVAGPRIYVAVHSAMMEVYGKAHPSPKHQ